MLVDQWTLYFDNTDEEKAIVNVRFAPTIMGGLIEFDVELNSIPIEDGLGKDVTVNWKMYNDF